MGIMKKSNELLGRMHNYLFLTPVMVQAFIEVCTVSLTGQIIRKFFWITETRVQRLSLSSLPLSQ